ncbi:transketolase [Candidatus Dojkabacteria bacterium]|uniref:Transketolase n=1 Tax=Candidatus Dojkabacteria bacterium TaxID=2099670 RepID=A0A955L925_9BACT|nr:transketolase [Candidatus Dojkabacteria bacterium]
MDTIKMLDKAGSGHVGGPLGMADLFTAVYYNFANIDPDNADSPDRDYILLSNGHICPIWYAVLGDLGYFREDAKDSLRKINSLLQGHPKVKIPGVENSSGPLGHGLSQAIGIALGLKMDKKKNRVVCFMSDGEHQEGQTWEAVMSAPKWNLDNLIAIMDYNGIQIEGTTDEIMPLGDLKSKYESFGWTALDVNGHRFEDILSTLEFADKVDGPVMIIGHTTGGKGVSFMEGKWEYHDWKGEEGDATKALAELEAYLQQLS